jgi:AraC family transcriptional regulator
MAEMEAPRLEEFGPKLIAGLGQRYNDQTKIGIPALWQRFVPHMGHIPGQTGRKSYGVVSAMDQNGTFEYLCGVEVSDLSAVPAEFCRVSLPKQRYAVFPHTGYISTIADTWLYLRNGWTPVPGIRMAKASKLEIYSESFNPSRPGGVAIWVPVEE